jgi:hypothetical protein
MNQEIFFNINKIIERDSKVTTYKFALLRGVIDIIQENSPFIEIKNERVYMPTGLLVEKWLLYYYPILESNKTIPQINGVNNLAFGNQFLSIIDSYKKNGGFSVFYNDLKTKGIPADIAKDFIELTKSIKNTITRMPMKYIGRSISEDYYSIFNYENGDRQVIPSVLDRSFLVKNLGSFSIPVEYYDAFRILGSFINGSDSILFKWAEFSVNASGKTLSFEKVVTEVLKSPITEREIRESKKLYKDELIKQGNVYCVWTGNRISKFDVDHVVPFSVWKNNDLWNLLPSDPATNNKKRDKIPCIDLIVRQKNIIMDYWTIISKRHNERFMKEIQISLLGNLSIENWQNDSFERLKNSCSYLINNRGYEEWKI